MFNDKERHMKATILLITALISFFTLPFLLPEPSFNGSNPGCSGSGCHSFQDGSVSVAELSNFQVEVTVTGTSSKVGGELVDEFGNVVSFINSTSTNPFILTAPSDGAYIVNAGYKNPSKKWDSSSVVFSTIVPPAAPSNLTASIINNPLSVELNWRDNSDNEDGFIIERDIVVADVYEILDTVSQNATTYVDTTVDVLTYNYRVKSFNSAGGSEYSDTAEVIVPVELSSFSVSIVDGGVSINWVTVTETNNFGFEIQRRLADMWETIGFVEGNGTITEQKNYYFFDDYKNLQVKGLVEYRLRQIDYDGTYTYSEIKKIEVDFIPDKFLLTQNYPNPFNPTTTIEYNIPYAGLVYLGVYNVIGEKIIELGNDVKQQGTYKVVWNAASFPSGIYYYKLVFEAEDRSSAKSIVKKMILLK
jgi:hypothetical protein